MSSNQHRIFHARRIIAQDRRFKPEAFATFGERIIDSGGLALLQDRFPRAETVELDGVVVPGFNDAHAHLAMAAEDLLHLDFSIHSVHSLAEIKDRIRAEATIRPAADWIRGSRYDDAKMSENRLLSRADLDAVAPDHPVMVLHVAGHWGVANSRALALGGIDESTEPPSGGAFGRDAAGKLNGVLYEQAIFNFAYPSVAQGGVSVAPASTLAERLHGLNRAQTMFFASGITSMGDALCGPADIALFTEAERLGDLKLRLNVMLAVDHYEKLHDLGVRTGFGNTRLRIGGIKSFVDGAIGGRTCLLADPFEGTDYHGMQTTPTDELREIVRRNQEDGNRLCVHCNGDRALEILLTAFEDAANEFPRPGLRHRIEHCSVVTEDILRRIKRLDVCAIPFAGYVAYHGSKLIDWYGEKRLERMFAHNWFLREGITVAGSSDYPCGPFEPLYGLQSMVTRRADDGPELGANQAVSVEEALAIYTLGSADAAGDAGVKGRLAPGYLADFVVLDDDPFASAPS
ncbi:MAG: amidohydrolase, partial [Vulcanimicrobiaceae bacterium]